MKEITHIVFSLGVAFALTSSFRELLGGPSWVRLALAVWLSFSVNRVIDGGLGHTFKETPEGELPVRSWRTHSVFTAPLWGVLVGSTTILSSWFFLKQMPFIQSGAAPINLTIWASLLGVVVAYSHLLPDSLSVDGEEWIIYEEHGVVKIGKIGEFVDRFFERPDQEGEREVEGIRVPCLNQTTLKFEWKTLHHVFRHKSGGSLVRLTLQTGRTITVTPNHSVFLVKDGEVVPVRAGQIRPGGFVLAPASIPDHAPPKAQELDTVVLLSTARAGNLDNVWLRNIPEPALGRLIPVVRAMTGRQVSQTYWRRRRMLPASCASLLHEDEFASVTVGGEQGARLPLRLLVDELFARVLGYYVAEGNTRGPGKRGKAGYVVVFNLGPNDERIVQFLTKTLSDLPGHPNVHIRKNKHSQGRSLEVSCKPLYYLLPLLCGKGAREKRVPEVILNSPQSVREAFFRAWVEGDGGVTASTELASDIQYLLLLSGVITSFGNWDYSRRSPAMIGGRVIIGGKSFHMLFPRPRGVATGVKLKERTEDAPQQVPLAVLPSYLRRAFITKQNGNTQRVTASLEAYFGRWRVALTKRRALSDHECRHDGLYRSAFWKGLLRKPNRHVLLTPIGTRIVSEINTVMKLGHGDLSFLRVKTTAAARPSSAFVYDVSVEGNESFVAGFGGVLCHNTQAGVYYWKRRVAIAHWKYDNFLANTAFTLLGVCLTILALRTG